MKGSRVWKEVVFFVSFLFSFERSFFMKFLERWVLGFDFLYVGRRGGVVGGLGAREGYLFYSRRVLGVSFIFLFFYGR